MRQPSIMRGISPEIDDVALNQRTKKMYTDMGTGLYFLAAFEHKIRGNRIESRFRLYKNPLVVDEDEFKAHQKSVHAKDVDLILTAPYMRSGPGGYVPPAVEEALNRYSNNPGAFGDPQ